MEGQPAEAPLKVCPHCSVASRTDADSCPTCGKPYGRPRVANAAAVTVELVVCDPDHRGAEVPDGIERSELAGRLDGESPALVRPKRGEKNVTCEYYGITNQPRAVWEFCFEGDTLVSSSSLGQTAPASSEALPEGLPDGL